MAYTTAEDVAGGFRTLTEDEQDKAVSLCNEAAVIIDTSGTKAGDDVKKVVSCRMIRRALGSGSVSGVPYGATQGSITAGPYAQQWTFNSGSSGELYLSSAEKRMLGLGNRCGFTASCLEERACRGQTLSCMSGRKRERTSTGTRYTRIIRRRSATS